MLNILSHRCYTSSNYSQDSPVIGLDSSAVRTKRYVEDIDRSSFKQFAIPAIGVEVGIKNHDPSNIFYGDEAYLEVQDLQSLVPQAKIKAVALHAKPSTTMVL